ncbi:Endonuclease/exonuclease/phosphatase [Cytidiella melzeri]|nr:Endonuclease/exonuclease/phosphatase [Cytidiella melzeri]
MAETPAQIVASLLRDSEDAKIAIETRLWEQVDPDTDAGPDSLSGSHEQGSAVQHNNTTKTRIIAVVTHLDSTTGDEQACLFCYKPRAVTSTYTVEHMFPIIDGFSISMAQSRRQTIDLSASSSASALNESRSELTLTINSGGGHANEPLILITQDIQRLRLLLAECKRLRDISVANTEPGVKPVYAWVLPYTFRPNAAILSPIPQDLRHAPRPVHELLAEVPAGSSTPATDAFDISVIREDWIRSQIRQRCCALAAEGQQTLLKLRIGTFNVNGNLPSQDLAAWVGVQSESSKCIPPLPEVSPFHVEDPTSSPLDAVVAELAVADDASSSKESMPSVSASHDSDVTAVYDEVGKTVQLEEEPDLIVLGFQELDLSAGALLYSTEKAREEAWLTAVMAGLGAKAAYYEKLSSKQLVGMLLVVIVKCSVRSCFTQVQTSSVGAGIMGLMGNKGGTALRLTFMPEPTAQAASPRPVVLTFVNAHLAAFDEMYEKRNADFHDLSKRLSFDSGISVNEIEEHGVTPSSWRSVPLTVYQSDALFWLGDLNYRLNLSDPDVRSLLAQEQDRPLNLPELLKYDQLKTAMRTRSAFAHFKEFPITHLPTYRFTPGVLTDSLGYDMKRKPAWTDRILHMCSYNADVTQLSYASHPEITMSDHRPVSAEFTVNALVVDSTTLETYVHTLWKDVADIEHAESGPQLVVEPSTIDFGNIGYKRPDRQVLRVENAGKIASTFRFISVAPGADIHPRWLQIEPIAGFVPAGEHIEVVLSVDIGNSEAAVLNLEDAAMEALLILHTSLGKDHFVAISGLWERTCFATSLQRLVRIPSPVRSLEKPELVAESQAATAPKELMRLVNWLMKYATDMDGLFLLPGEPAKVTTFQEYLDTGEELPVPNAVDRLPLSWSAAQCLLQFLDSLPDALAPVALHPRCASVSSREEAFELLNEFPGVSVNVWIAVTSFLHFVCQQDASSGHSNRADKLAAVFAPVLFRTDGARPSAVVSHVGLRRFVESFIV